MKFLPCADGTLRFYLADIITTSVEVCTWHAHLEADVQAIVVPPNPPSP